MLGEPRLHRAVMKLAKADPYTMRDTLCATIGAYGEPTEDRERARTPGGLYLKLATAMNNGL